MNIAQIVAKEAIIVTTDKKIIIDGILDEWTEAIPVILNDKKQLTYGKNEWKGPHDLSAEVYLMVDHKNLYLAAKVKDDYPAINNNCKAGIYNGDCIELYIGMDPTQQKTVYTPLDYQFGFSVGNPIDPPEIWCFSAVSAICGSGNIKDGEICINKWSDNKGYNLEAKIPLRNFMYFIPIEGRKFKFDIAVDDCDEGKLRKTQLTWHGDGSGWQDPTVWGSATIVRKDSGEDTELHLYFPEKIQLTGLEEKVDVYVLKNFTGVNAAKILVENKEYFTDESGKAIPTVKKTGRGKIIAQLGNKKIEREYFVLSVKPIIVNQVGYLPDRPKIFFVTKPATSFYLIDLKTDKTVYHGKLIYKGIDRSSKDTIWEGDFSDFSVPGRYKIAIPEIEEESYPFKIERNVYFDVYYKVMRSYFLQRCGEPIDDKITGFKKGFCHMQKAELHPSTGEKGFLDVSGGWHDAGDYGRYLPTANITVGHFLLLYQLFPDRFKDGELNIPESGNGIPDILDETRYELEWMLKMQRADGGVYHKVTTKQFPDMWLPPERDTDPLYICKVNTPVTEGFAAAMAMAARVYQKFDPEFAKKCLQASKKAWKFSNANEFIGFSNPKDISTGEYAIGLNDHTRFWAAVELYLTTGEEEYHTYVKEHYTKIFSGREAITGISWDMVHTLGMYSYYFGDRGDPTIKNYIKMKTISTADSIIKNLINMKDNFYKTALLEFTYTSNRRIAAGSVILLMANLMHPKREYEDNALEQLHYILGRNTLNKCYVTGVGTDYPQKPHNRLVVSKDIMIPGLLVQGPNDPVKGPKGYYDVIESFLTNENAIDFSAPLVVLTAYFSKL